MFLGLSILEMLLAFTSTRCQKCLLHGDLYEDIYNKVPPSLSSNNPNAIYKLQKLLYGLKQVFSQCLLSICILFHRRGYKHSLDHYFGLAQRV